MSSIPITPHEVHTLREIIREQEQSAKRDGRELAGPWLTIKRLLDERDNLTSALQIHRNKMREIIEIGCSYSCGPDLEEFLQEVPF